MKLFVVIQLADSISGISFYIGLPIELQGKVARSKLANQNGIGAALSNFSTILRDAFSPRVNYEALSRQQIAWLTPTNGVNLFNNPEVQAMEIPAANGIGTARGLASIFAFAMDGRLGISPDVLRMITVPEMQGVSDMFTAGWVSNTGWGFRFTKNPR
uniref:Uncharacterized protein n=1 Tax=Plectus sambesii TaxID=2011161 RepID=A0A914VFW7_9BILA